MKAAVMRANNAPLELEDVQIDSPGPGEVLVKTVASGICHSDLTVLEGGLPLPPPCVLGHEPAGIVEEVGDGVADFAPGDHVISSRSVFGTTNVIYDRYLKKFNIDTTLVDLNDLDQWRAAIRPERWKPSAAGGVRALSTWKVSRRSALGPGCPREVSRTTPSGTKSN